MHDLAHYLTDRSIELISASMLSHPSLFAESLKQTCLLARGFAEQEKSNEPGIGLHLLLRTDSAPEAQALVKQTFSQVSVMFDDYLASLDNPTALKSKAESTNLDLTSLGDLVNRVADAASANSNSLDDELSRAAAVCCTGTFFRTEHVVQMVSEASARIEAMMAKVQRHRTNGPQGNSQEYRQRKTCQKCSYRSTKLFLALP